MIRKNRNQKEHKVQRKSVLALLLTFLLVMTAGCGGNGKSSEAGSSGGDSSGSVEALADVNVIPEDGIITKEQFETIAGQDKQIQFTGETEDGISYVWTFDASKIQNPQDQNLKIAFTSEGLDEIKTQANDANDALKMTMTGKGLICVPTLTVTLPECWKSNAGLLLKEQNESLAKMSDVTIESQSKAENDGAAAETTTETDSTEPTEGTTVLTMTVTSLDGECYVVGGITDAQNKGAESANGNNGLSGNSGNAVSGGNSSSSSGSGDVKNGSSSANKVQTCTISISCSTILNNMDSLTAGKEEFVPSNGLILAPSTVEITEGESVHDVLKRVCKEAGIHMESSYSPVYDSAYVEGINQLYEFDCGDLSGWMYSVNGWFPNYGCSKYTVSDGDVIKWVYTCDLGKDVGDNSMH